MQCRKEMAQERLARLYAVRAFVHELNSKFIKNEQVAARLVQEDKESRMLTTFWDPAFTHITANPSNGMNNEVLENVGDSILDGQFTIYLTRRLPKGTELMYTEMGNVYTGNEYLAARSDELGLPKLLATRGVPEPTEGMKADVLEAYIGALVMAGNKIVDGLGSSLAYEFVAFLFDGVELDILKGEGAPGTKVEQMFTRFGMPPPIVEYGRKGSLGVSYIYLNEKHIQFLQYERFDFPTSDKLLIGEGSDKDKDRATAKAYENALRSLMEKGVTPAWAVNLKNTKEMSAPEVKDYVDAASQRAAKDGIVSMYFSAPGKASTADGFTILLVGVMVDGTRNTLHAKYFTYGPNRQKESRERKIARGVVIREYAEGK